MNAVPDIDAKAREARAAADIAPLSWPEIIRQFFGVMFQTAVRLYKRKPGQRAFVTDAQWITRMSACLAPCEHLTAKGRCALCKCPVRRAAHFSTKPCLAGKWPDLTTSTPTPPPEQP